MAWKYSSNNWKLTHKFFSEFFNLKVFFKLPKLQLRKIISEINVFLMVKCCISSKCNYHSTLEIDPIESVCVCLCVLCTCMCAVMHV